MIDPWTYFLVEELIFPEESGGVTGEGAFGFEPPSKIQEKAVKGWSA